MISMKFSNFNFLGAYDVPFLSKMGILNIRANDSTTHLAGYVPDLGVHKNLQSPIPT